MLDPLLLRTFLFIAAGNSFSETSRKLSMRQSTVSDHIKRLEQSLGHRLFKRDTQSVALTREGEALIDFARDILEVLERTERHFAGTRLRGRVRLGAASDLGTSWLMPVLRAFVQAHPEIDLDLTVASSATLRLRIEAGDLDIAICERGPGETGGDLLWQEDLAWIGTQAAMEAATLPLVLHPAPSITRAIALARLEQGTRPWRVACTGDGVDALLAAAGAGLGIAVVPGRLAPAALQPPHDLPALGRLDVVALRHRQAPGAAASEILALIRAAGRAG